MIRQDSPTRQPDRADTPGRGLDSKQAAARLGVSARTLQRYLDKYLTEDDRSKGFTPEKVHVNRGHGYEWRFYFDTDASGDASPDAPPETSTLVTVVPVIKPLVVTTTPPPGDRELAVLALRALDDMRGEIERLRAMVESLRPPQQPWWRRWRRGR